MGVLIGPEADYCCDIPFALGVRPICPFEET
jgi:hypothetical protein